VPAVFAAIHSQALFYLDSIIMLGKTISNARDKKLINIVGLKRIKEY